MAARALVAAIRAEVAAVAMAVAVVVVVVAAAVARQHVALMVRWRRCPVRRRPRRATRR